MPPNVNERKQARKGDSGNRSLTRRGTDKPSIHRGRWNLAAIFPRRSRGLTDGKHSHAGSAFDHLFHGIFAKHIAMPQVSVMPANMRPAPTKPLSPMNHG